MELPLLSVTQVGSFVLRIRRAELLLSHAAAGRVVVVAEAVFEVDASGPAEQRHAVHNVG